MCNDDLTLPKKNDAKKDNFSRTSFRAGTDLTYHRIREEDTISRPTRDTAYISDIAYIKPEGDFYIAISLQTGFTALGESPEDAYSCLVFKLLDSLREVVHHPKAQIGQAVSDKLREESLRGLKMPQDRQTRALLKGIGEFISTPHEGSTLYLRKLESDPYAAITTQNLEDTDLGTIDVDILDAFEINQIEDDLITLNEENP
jgi:hypothetical protein